MRLGRSSLKRDETKTRETHGAIVVVTTKVTPPRYRVLSVVGAVRSQPNVYPPFLLDRHETDLAEERPNQLGQTREES